MSPVGPYLAQHAVVPPGEDQLPPPAAALKLCVVIPALAERERLAGVLDSLAQGSQRWNEAEVLVLVNNSESASPDILSNNLQTLAEVKKYSGPLRVFGLDRCSPGRALAARTAGVGMARRLGMDAALLRLQQAGQDGRAAIACLDADSPVGPGYIDAVLGIFDQEDAPTGGLCAYAHPLPADPRLSAAIIAYELWLRYFVAGLKLAGSLFAFPAIGSCMVVSARGYAQAKGMEPRRAGEDFHFLRKLAKLSGWRPLANLEQAKVYPEARISDRVPFGTGRAMRMCLEQGAEAYLYVAPAETFSALQTFFGAAEEGFKNLQRLRAGLRPWLADFLEAEGAWPVLERFQKTYPSARHFALAVQHWFDSLRIVRLANLRCRRQGGAWLFDAWSTVLAGLDRSRLTADLPRPKPGSRDQEPYLAWLERARKL